MALSPDEIIAFPGLHDFIQAQSASFLEIFSRDPRLAAMFATQQRWLLSHIGLSLYLRAPSSKGFYIAAFLDEAQKHGVASRNTAAAFIKELEHYKYISVQPDAVDKRRKRLVLTPGVIELFGAWLHTHLASLDGLTGGTRAQAFLQDTAVAALVQPVICAGLLGAQALRYPEKTFSLFTWLDNGGIVMDWLITNMERVPLNRERVRVGAFSVAEMASRLNLSRTHLSRKLREAESLGSIGWEGRRGHSGLWVSSGFRFEYTYVQATKLSIIDHAWEKVVALPADVAPADAHRPMQPQSPSGPEMPPEMVRSELSDDVDALQDSA